jgi:hypothetical protein
MVTNERQRQYAIESRKASGSTPSLEERAKAFELAPASGSTPSLEERVKVFQLAPASESHQDEAQTTNRGPSPYHGSTNIFEANPQPFADQHQIIDLTSPGKRQQMATPNHIPEVHDDSVQPLTPPNEPPRTSYIVQNRSPSDADDSDIELQVEILGSLSSARASKQTHQSLRASSTIYPTFDSFSATMIAASQKLMPYETQEANPEYPADPKEAAPKRPRVECHLETGLVEIENDNEYQSALETVRNTVWMAQSLKVILRW